MNTETKKKLLKELGRVAECNPFQYHRVQALILIAFFTFGVVVSLNTDPLLPAEHPQVAHDKPNNWPEFDNPVFREKAEKTVCHGKIVRPGGHIKADRVVVVKQNGKMVAMDTGEAFRRVDTKNEYDNVWTIGVCKKHIQR